MRNFTAEFQWKNQEKDGRTLSRGMHYRFQEYEVGGKKLGLEKMNASSWGRLGSRRSCSATHGWMEHNYIFTFYIKQMQHNYIFTFYIKQIQEVRTFCIPCIQKPGFRLHYSLDDPRFESQQKQGIYPSYKSTERLQGSPVSFSVGTNVLSGR